MCAACSCALLLDLAPALETLSISIGLLLPPPPVAGAAGIIAASTTVGIRSAGRSVSTLASSLVFGVGLPEHAMGQIVREGQRAYSNFELKSTPTFAVITSTAAEIKSNNVVKIYKHTQTKFPEQNKSHIGGH